MDTLKCNQYFEKVSELVYDKDRIVTCVSMAELLNISIEDSKLLLAKFIEDQRQKKPYELSVSYLLSGITHGSNCPTSTVTVVKEEDLQERKAKFEKINSELPYSIQKANNIDFNIIAQIEKHHSDNPRTQSIIGSVVGINCIKRTLQPRTLPVPPTAQQQASKTKSSFFTKIESKPGIKTEIRSEKEDSKTKKDNAKSMQDVKVKNKGGIANFFTKSSAKTVENGKTCKNEPIENKSETKANDKKEDEKTYSSTHKEAPAPVDIEQKMEVDIPDNNDQKEVPSVKRKEPQNQSKKNKKKRPNKENNDQPNKKRKRIVQRDDSDSDDMFGGDDDNYDDIIEQSMEDQEPPPEQKAPLAPKNKIRKAVDKTYEDEEGYIVTRTEYVYETPSDDETDDVVKPPEKSHPKTPISEEKNKSNSAQDDCSPVHNKASKSKKGKKAPAANQPTLMNFFKRK